MGTSKLTRGMQRINCKLLTDIDKLVQSFTSLLIYITEKQIIVSRLVRFKLCEMAEA